MAPKDKPSPATAPEGERIAKVLSRRGVASRREAERLIEAGEVTVNGKTITSPALNVTAKDRITISGHPLPAEEPARLWLYYKPEGLVTSAADEKGRDTVFDHLPEDMPRVMSVGRLDLNSEGLLLLTNDGELKRRLELPSTGWLRKYRVRVNGNPTDDQLEPLRKGITIEGEKFQPMQVTLDRIQGANAWLTVGLREGRNREIRRAMNAIDIYVNRLIRTSYGPFRLNNLQPGEVEEVRQKVLREQLGEAPETTDPDTKRPALKRGPRKTAAAAPRHATEIDAPTPRRAGKPAASGARTAGKTFSTAGRSAGARSAAGSEKITLPRNAKPGDGLKALSRAWKEAVTPDPDGRPARPSAPKPAPRGEAKPAARSSAKPAPSGKASAPRAEGKLFAKPAGKIAPRDAAKPAARRTTEGTAPRGAGQGTGRGKPPPRRGG